MSGPVWRFDSRQQGVCAVCLRRQDGLFVEGEIVDNEMKARRLVCRECYQRETHAVVAGESLGHAAAPAYAHR